MLAKVAQAKGEPRVAVELARQALLIGFEIKAIHGQGDTWRC